MIQQQKASFMSEQSCVMSQFNIWGLLKCLAMNNSNSDTCLRKRFNVTYSHKNFLQFSRHLAFNALLKGLFTQCLVFNQSCNTTQDSEIRIHFILLNVKYYT